MRWNRLYPDCADGAASWKCLNGLALSPCLYLSVCLVPFLVSCGQQQTGRDQLSTLGRAECRVGMKSRCHFSIGRINPAKQPSLVNRSVSPCLGGGGVDALAVSGLARNTQHTKTHQNAGLALTAGRGEPRARDQTRGAQRRGASSQEPRA